VSTRISSDLRLSRPSRAHRLLQLSTVVPYTKLTLYSAVRMKKLTSKLGAAVLLALVAPSLMAASTPGYVFVKRMNGLKVSSTAAMPPPNTETTVPSTPPAPLTYLANLSAQSLDFGGTPVGSPLTKSVLLSNTGTGPLSVSAPAVVGSAFSAATDCSTTLAPGASCQTSVTFTPTQVAAASGSVTVSSNASNGPLVVSLTGTGTDPYVANVSLWLKGDAAPIQDSSPSPKSVTAYGTAAANTGTKVAGTGSLYFDGASYLSSPANGGFSFATRDFTVESWVYLTKLTPYAVLSSVWTGTASTSSWLVSQGSTASNLRFGYSDGSNVNFVETNGGLTTNKWTHIAVSRQAGTLRMFVDGVQRYSGSVPTLASPSMNLGVMSISNGQYPSAGYLDNLRITNGTARYTSNFTPSADY
jgi:hypothetical protein